MRTVYALDFAVAVARAMDAATGLKLGEKLVEERRADLEREVELEAAHEAFFRAVASFLPEDVTQELACKLDISRSESVCQTLMEAACSRTEDAKPNKTHWRKCSMHQDLLRRMFICYLDCLMGWEARFDDPLADFASRFQRELEHEVEKKCDEFFARWGKVMILPDNLKSLLAALERLPEARHFGALKDIFLTIVRADDFPNTDEFAIVVRHFAESKDEKDVN